MNQGNKEILQAIPVPSAPVSAPVRLFGVLQNIESDPHGSSVFFCTQASKHKPPSTEHPVIFPNQEETSCVSWLIGQFPW